MLSVARSLNRANQQMPLEGETHFADLKKQYSKGRELAGKTLGIIGFGRIGQRLAMNATGIGDEGHLHDPFITDRKRIRLSL